jgi:hypothetical protein
MIRLIMYSRIKCYAPLWKRPTATTTTPLNHHHHHHQYHHLFKKICLIFLALISRGRCHAIQPVKVITKLFFMWLYFDRCHSAKNDNFSGTVCMQKLVGGRFFFFFLRGIFINVTYLISCTLNTAPQLHSSTHKAPF